MNLNIIKVLVFLFVSVSLYGQVTYGWSYEEYFNANPHCDYYFIVYEREYLSGPFTVLDTTGINDVTYTVLQDSLYSNVYREFYVTVVGRGLCPGDTTAGYFTMESAPSNTVVTFFGRNKEIQNIKIGEF